MKERNKVLILGTDQELVSAAVNRVLQTEKWGVIINTDLRPLPRKVRKELVVCLAVSRESDVETQALLHQWMRANVYGCSVMINWWTAAERK